MSSVHQDIAAYEAWLRKQCDVVEDDLEAKHERMLDGPFAFLRATYFRWARRIDAACPELGDAPKAASVGDIHVENFGTWRDADARLVWGINDFDEAAVMPYAYDLVRLTTSARLVPHLTLDARSVATAIARGYRKGLAEPRAVLLDEFEHWMRPFADGDKNANREFWSEVAEYPDANPPAVVRRALKKTLPERAEVVRFASRRKGGGSLGRPRYLVIARWNSGSVLREAKALVPSAWDWAHAGKGRGSRFIELAYGRHRSPDPILAIKGDYIVRRVAPDARKIEIKDIERQGLSTRLLTAMGADLGAVHAADERSKAILADLESRKRGWLHRAADAAEAMTLLDYHALAG